MGAIEYQGTAMGGAEFGMGNPEALFNEMPYPNPMTTHITFPLDGQIKKASKSLRIFNQSGRMVYTRSSCRAMEYFTWDGTDTTGMKVKPGQYFYLFGINGATHKGSIMVTR
jgi:flagellar hook assembly protein FlgD